MNPHLYVCVYILSRFLRHMITSLRHRRHVTLQCSAEPCHFSEPPGAYVFKVYLKMAAIGETDGFSLLHFSVGSSNALCDPSQSSFGIRYRIKCIWPKLIYFQKINQESNCKLRRFLTGVSFMFIYDHPPSHLADETILNFHSLNH